MNGKQSCGKINKDRLNVKRSYTVKGKYDYASFRIC